MPRAGLTTDNAVAAAAGLTGETCSGNLTVGLIAQRLGIRPPGITTLPGSGDYPSPGSLHRSHRRPRSPRPGASSLAQERSDAFARLAEHAAAGKPTVEYRETGLEALPAIGADFTAGRPQTKIIIKPNEVTPRDRPRLRPRPAANHWPLTGVPGQGTLSSGIPADQRKPPEPARPDR